MNEANSDHFGDKQKNVDNYIWRTNITSTNYFKLVVTFTITGIICKLVYVQSLHWLII